MLMPKKVKYRKVQRGRMKGKAWRGSSIAFGEYALKAMDCGWITSRQIEAARIAMTRFIKRGGKVWIRLFPDKPITKKPAETRMGKGKGAPEEWVAVIRPGKILFEMEGVAPEIAQQAMRLAAHKIPMKTKFVARRRWSRVRNEERQIAGTRSRRKCRTSCGKSTSSRSGFEVPDVDGPDRGSEADCAKCAGTGRAC